jgi:CTP synthase (UTP-ammonia lyase)
VIVIPATPASCPPAGPAVAHYHLPMRAVRVVVLGDRDTRFETHRAIDHTLTLMPAGVEAAWVGTDQPFTAASADAIWCAPGTPYRDEAAAYRAIETARTSAIPLLGTCGGFQYMMVEFARNAAGIADAAHQEADPDAAQPVVAALACSLVGQRRQIRPVAGTRLAELVGDQPFSGFHYCNYGLNPAYRDRLAAAGLVVAAHADDADVEAVELPEHPFYMATLFQPQMETLGSTTLHPLLAALVEAGRVALSVRA